MIHTRLEPDAANRGLEVIAESGDFYRSSAIQLEGDRAPRTVRFEFRSLPAGVYEVRAAVLGRDGQRRALARSRVNVVETRTSRSVEPDPIRTDNLFCADRQGQARQPG